MNHIVSCLDRAVIRRKQLIQCPSVIRNEMTRATKDRKKERLAKNEKKIGEFFSEAC